MKIVSKILLPLISIIIVTGCTIPGSHLTVSDKNIVQTNTPDNQKIESVNVYPLSPSFVRQYSENSNVHGQLQTNPALDKKVAQYEYRVGAGDVLNITVWGHPELTIPAGSYRSAEEAGHWVHSNGKIFYPYVGFVDVQGKTVVEIGKLLADKLSKFVNSPQVDVNLAAFRSQKVYVIGEIVQPGQQFITNVPLTLLDAINQGGGLTEVADWRNVTLTRAGQSESISLYKLIQDGELTQNRLMQEGDILHIPNNDEQKIFVLGDVGSPSLLKIDRSGMSITEALTSVGGINEISADATGVFVIRSAQRDAPNQEFLKSYQQKNQPQSETNAADSSIANIYQLDVTDATALMTGTGFELQPYDVVYVTAAPLTRWNRVMAQLLPSISGFDNLSNSILSIQNW
ncbi:sugar transporter [Psychromonas sp. MB-3u-54]|uniref:polysaccharide export protein n=1 Tax=Psychromonas sp. MB-3u-54 TaxID=2058319 RepID=UPI000C348471|nr:polysaccharide export protein [Psychromonas sp. MB-3u-54]PKH03431.1 sugar transporter [Psychromonas sp. MB-3u-54]